MDGLGPTPLGGGYAPGGGGCIYPGAKKEAFISNSVIKDGKSSK